MSTDRVSTKRNTEFRYGIALTTVVSSMVMFLLWGDHEVVSVTAVLLQALALLTIYYSANLTPRHKWGARFGGVFAAAVLYGTLLGSGDVVRVGAGTIGAGVTLALSMGLLRAMAKQPEVDTRTILGAITVYLAVGLFFAQLFWVVDLWSQGMFFAQRPDANMTDFTYFSYVTMTTVGYGDFNPATPVARALAVGEAMLGQLYLVTVLAVIVSNVGREKTEVEGAGLGAVVNPRSAPPTE
jgi:uncharacterized membrane protein